MAGYSDTPLERKLGVREGDRVFLDGPPAGFELAVPTTRRLPATVELALTFQTRRSALARRLPALLDRMEPAGMIWICWPKKAAAKELRIDTDLDENVVREVGLAGASWTSRCARSTRSGRA